MGIFIDLLYKLILPLAKREGVDPESVVSRIRKNQKAIADLEGQLKKKFDDGEMKTKDGQVLKYNNLFPDNSGNIEPEEPDERSLLERVGSYVILNDEHTTISEIQKYYEISYKNAADTMYKLRELKIADVDDERNWYPLVENLQQLKKVLKNQALH
ncbi:hypothetical protein JNM05_03370 [bacterium]|nr:hypothetical protein [bacterium]